MSDHMKSGSTPKHTPRSTPRPTPRSKRSKSRQLKPNTPIILDNKNPDSERIEEIPTDFSSRHQQLLQTLEEDLLDASQDEEEYNQDS